MSSATFSPCRTYRYVLRREWSAAPPLVVIGLNPSTADETRDDPTIRRLISFAKRDGFGGLVMLNLFAFRSTASEGLLGLTDPIGENNDAHVRAWCVSTKDAPTLAAWGSHKKLGALVTTRARAVRDMLGAFNVRLMCLGVNSDGQPKHPLYLAKTTPIIPLEAA